MSQKREPESGFLHVTPRFHHPIIPESVPWDAASALILPDLLSQPPRNHQP